MVHVASGRKLLCNAGFRWNGLHGPVCLWNSFRSFKPLKPKYRRISNGLITTCFRYNDARRNRPYPAELTPFSLTYVLLVLPSLWDTKPPRVIPVDGILQRSIISMLLSMKLEKVLMLVATSHSTLFPYSTSILILTNH